MMKQYSLIKDKYLDSILLYRMGDFYEMFFEDAKIASKILSIALTSRNKKDTTPIPMCGFPHKSAQNYISKLVENGYKVAICDQVSDFFKGKGLVERRVVRVVTPGMLVDNDLLKEKVNNFVTALERNKHKFGIASLDISTGFFSVTESVNKTDIIDEIIRIAPSEILISNQLKEKLIINMLSNNFGNICISKKNIFFDYRISRQTLLKQFNAISLDGFGCNDMVAGIIAAAALVNYINETQQQEVQHIRKIQPYSLDNFLIVDGQSCKNLELFESIKPGLKDETLINVIDVTITAMGGRLLNNWMRYPLINHKEISARYDAVSELVDNVKARYHIRQLLKRVFDIERIIGKVSTGNANARDLKALKESIQIMPEFFKIISNLTSKLYSFNSKKVPNKLHSLSNLIEKSIRNDAPSVVNEGNMIKKGFSSKLDNLIKITKEGKNWIINFEIKERKSTGINSLKVRYNKIFGYYIEIPKTKSKNVPSNYLRKQTLVNVERYTTELLKGVESEIFGSENQRKSLEFEIFKEILLEVKKCSQDIQELAVFVSVVDCIASLALVADKNCYCRPTLNSNGLLDIELGRHPVIENIIDEERFVPNSIKMDNNNSQILIITGPNMAGKSTILRQIALCIIMAQMGSFVPSEKANIPIIDKIFTRVGALDNLAAGQSTFMVEMQETANILNNATKNSLVIIDEIGRGTSTSDGLSIAWAVIEYLHDLNNVGVKSILATHYHELTDLENKKSKIVNFNITAQEIDEKIIFMRKLIKGSTNKSYGIQVAQLAGIPKCVIERSKEILSKLENKNYDLATAQLRDDTIINSDNKIKNHMVYSNNFTKQEAIISMIRNVDILKMTPIDALNYLSMLQSKVQVMS